ncbi:hypothetical protein FACS189443_1210 [Planctomycetales bacterium]|nr:hypothetical protein FACS189443_1210 [Planctomycetales bacterium]
MLPISSWKKSIRFAAHSDIGLRRGNNQDSFLVKTASTAKDWLDWGHLFVLADGMGAHVAGEVASRLAVETVVKSYTSHSAPPNRSLVQALFDAHQAIRSRGDQEAYRAMGTTCDALALTPQGFFIAHVGDSRVYRLRGNNFEQLTFDHSLVWEVCAATNSPFDHPPHHIPKNQITRSLGPTEKLVVDLEGPLPIQVGDIFLSCSDGLSGQVSDVEIGQILSVFPPDLAIETLINIANLRGGPDNITIIVAQTLEDEHDNEEVEQAMKVSLKYWGVFGLTLLSVFGIAASFIWGNAFLSTLFGVLAVVLATIFFSLTKKTLFSGSPFQPSCEPTGKAPYRQWHCVPTSDFTQSLVQILNELRQATRSRQFDINSDEAGLCEKRADVAFQKKDYAESIRQYAMAINFLMRELKNKRVKKNNAP